MMPFQPMRPDSASLVATHIDTQEASNVSNSRTLIRGQKIHHNAVLNFSFWRPLNWHQADLAAPHGVVYYPEDDPRTGFYVTATELDALEGDISEADLPALHEGLHEGLQQLPDCQVLSDEPITLQKAHGFDFLVTFNLNGDPCKRRLRILYLGRRQYTLYGQGVPPDEYDVFQHIFDYMVLTFRFGDLSLDMGVPVMPDFSPMRTTDGRGN